MPPVRRSQIDAHEIRRGKGLEIRLSLALSTIQMTVRFSSVKFPEAGVHYRLFSVWTLVPVRLDQQLSDHSTVDEIASGAADCRLTYTMANCPQRRKEERKRERETEGKRARKRQGLVVLGSGEENPRVLFGDADQESESRMSKNALRTGRRQAVDGDGGNFRRKRKEFEERGQTREYELERLRLSNATETVSVSSANLEGQGVNRRVNLKDLVPKFDAKNADINLFFEIFERQAKKEKVAEDRWVSQLIPLIPIEIAEIVAKEPLEKSDDYPHIKKSTLGPVPTHTDSP
ncbi:hypothetical protein TNCV_978281 [Trichonephila clavipes]|nr:hypothetical protein TNCV_978281 [Trichonephila clavipes]